MKQSLPMPAIIGVVAAVLAVGAIFLVKIATAEPHTPRPDPAMFSGSGAAKSLPVTH